MFTPSRAPDCRLGGDVPPGRLYTSNLNPIQRATLPQPDVAHDQDAQEDEHLDQAKESQDVVLNSPRKQINRFDVENDKEDRDEVIAHGVAAARIGFGRDSALVGHQLLFAGWRGGAYELQEPQRGQRKDSGKRGEGEDGSILVEHGGVPSSAQAESYHGWQGSVGN